MAPKGTTLKSVGTRNPEALGVQEVPKDLQVGVFVLFFAFGGITSLNDILIPKLKSLFTLSYGKVMLVQSAFFAAYFIVSLPAAALVQRLGYMRSASAGLAVMTLGCLLFVPASSSGLFGLFLVALFVLAAGITTVQVVANPLVSLLGPASTASSRLTFAQAFNSLGTTVFPYIGSLLILGSLATVDAVKLYGEALNAYRASETHVIVCTYLGLAVALLTLASVVWSRRNDLTIERADGAAIIHPGGWLARPRFAFGTVCIFLYVGGEVTIGSLIVSYLMQSSVLSISAVAAGEYVPIYWGGAMVGRFIGAYVLRLFAPGSVLAFVALMAVVLLGISANCVGGLSAWSLLAVGFSNSIMFPTVFSLASKGLGKHTAEGSGILCMAIVGGAVVPVLAGSVADLWDLRAALIVPAICYGAVLLFGWCTRRSVDEVGAEIAA